METLLKTKRKQEESNSKQESREGAFHTAFFVWIWNKAKNQTAAKLDDNDSFIPCQGFTDATDEKTS